MNLADFLHGDLKDRNLGSLNYIAKLKDASTVSNNTTWGASQLLIHARFIEGSLKLGY